ncbi:MAG: hypothetical protein WBB45_07120 [Cyclobacteriaceae bacterium]
MKKLLIIFCFTAILLGCDYFSETRICNQIGKDITLKIAFDSSEVNSWSGGMLSNNLTKFLSNYGENLNPIDIDTINYTATYLIRADSCASIEGGNNPRPTFHFFKYLEVINENDTLKLITKEQMIKAFDADRERPEFYFDLLIMEGINNTSR